MKKRKHKKTKIFLGILTILAVAIALFYVFGASQQILPYPETTKTLMLSGNPVEVTTIFGSYVNAPRTPDICGSNDGDVNAGNDATQSGENIVLSSSMSTAGRDCGSSNNELRAKTTLPGGVLTITYSLVYPQNFMYELIPEG